MNCPFCKTKLDLESPTGQEEIYYDCSVCNSSLLLKSTGLEILNEGRLEPAQTPVDEPPLEKNPVNTIPKDALLEDAIPPTKNLEENSEDAIPQKENLEENREDEVLDQDEEVLDQEPTQVPVLNQPEQNTDDLIKEPSSDLKKTNATQETFKNDLNKTPVEEQNIKSQEATFKDNQILKKTIKEEILKQDEVPEINNSSQQDPALKKTEKEDFAEVAEFANSQNQDQQGPYLYDLILSEINSQDLKQQVLTVLEDESLKLAEKNSSLKDKIKDGKILVQKISPIQAYVIVTSLMGLPLDIFWEQTHFTNT